VDTAPDMETHVRCFKRMINGRHRVRQKDKPFSFSSFLFYILAMEITFVEQAFNNAEFVEGMMGLAQIGYQKVESKDQRIRDFGADKLEAILTEYHLSMIQINTYFNVVQGRAAIEKSLALNQEMIGYAKRFKAPFIRVFTGPLGNGSIGTDNATPDIWKEATDALRLICKEGDQSGIAYAVETHHGTLAENSTGILKLLEMTDCPNFHVNLQIPLKGEPDVYDSTRLLAPYVRHAHLNNYDTEGHFTHLSDGMYDIRKEIEILRKAGYDGALSVEHAYHHRPIIHTAKREFEFLSRIVQELG